MCSSKLFCNSGRLGVLNDSRRPRQDHRLRYKTPAPASLDAPPEAVVVRPGKLPEGSSPVVGPPNEFGLRPMRTCGHSGALAPSRTNLVAGRANVVLVDTIGRIAAIPRHKAQSVVPSTIRQIGTRKERGRWTIRADRRSDGKRCDKDNDDSDGSLEHLECLRLSGEFEIESPF